MNTAVVSVQKNKIHPHKFTLWIAIASIIMMFAGLTSAFIVKSTDTGWQGLIMPKVFFYSTGVMLISSLTIQWALKSFKERAMKRYRMLMTITAGLGVVFVILQWLGFDWMWERGVHFEGASGAGQFLYVIFGLHAVHVLGGVIALLVMFFRAFSPRIRSYNPVPVEVISTYWHFVDALWLYLFIFFLWQV